MTTFTFQTRVRPEWIDYNGHMRDAFYGLVFSLAVDDIWDEIGIDRAYREATQCTLYLVEDHKFYIAEVKEGAPLTVETVVLDHSDKMIHLHLTMTSGGRLSAVCEFLELHVSQQGTPHATPMPPEIVARLARAQAEAGATAGLSWRSRELGIRRKMG